MMIKIALILTIITLVSIFITRVLVSNMETVKILEAKLTNKWPRNIQIMVCLTLLFAVGTVIMWIIAIATY